MKKKILLYKLIFEKENGKILKEIKKNIWYIGMNTIFKFFEYQ